MSDDRPTSDAFAQHRRDRGLSRLRESRRLGAIGQQGKSWSVVEASKDGFSGFFYSLVRRMEDLKQAIEYNIIFAEKRSYEKHVDVVLDLFRWITRRHPDVLRLDAYETD